MSKEIVGKLNHSFFHLEAILIVGLLVIIIHFVTVWFLHPTDKDKLATDLFFQLPYTFETPLKRQIYLFIADNKFHPFKVRISLSAGCIFDDFSLRPGKILFLYHLEYLSIYRM